MTLEIRRDDNQASRLHALRERRWADLHLSVIWIVLPLLLLDAGCIMGSMKLAYHVRFELLAYAAPFSPDFYTRLTWIAIPLWLGIFALCRLYQPAHLFGGLQEYAGVLNACTFGLVGLVLCGFLDRSVEHDISRGWWGLVWLFSLTSVSVVRFGYRRLVYYLRCRGLFLRRVLIVGVNAEGRVVARQLQSSPTAGLDVVGFVDPVLPRGAEVEALPVVGNIDMLDRLVDRLRIDELILIPTGLRRERLLDIYRDWGAHDRVRVSLSSGLYELFTTGVQVREAGFVPLVSLNRTRITGMDACLKAVLDYAGALLICVLLAPFFPLVALAIYLDSPGPIFYRRRVVGLQGRQFDAYKLRTMRPDADAYLEAHPRLKEMWEQTGKISDDPRITRVGRFLRRFSIDELPQLINVLLGQMSLVGPRMITAAELKHFGCWRHNLMTVKPGLTGLWQVSGRADLDYAERVKLDMHYIRNYTIWADLKLLFETVKAVLSGRGAY